MKAYYQNKLVTLYNGDCLEVMDYLISQDIKVDAVITDPPYGTIACRWDTIIPFDKMWERLNKLAKDDTPIVLFGSEPFSSKLRMSNLKYYRYDWIWDKMKSGNIMLAKYQPMKIHEIISVFSKRTHKYYPKEMARDKVKRSRCYSVGKTMRAVNFKSSKIIEYTTKQPESIITITNAIQKGKQHPTQKPLALMEYLVETYTKKGNLVLDFTCGSGTTLVACDTLGRRCIGIELEKKYCAITEKRLSNMQLKMDI